MKKPSRSPPRAEPFDIPGVGLVPMLYIEAWGAYEAFRRLGFKDEEVTLLVAGNVDTGTLRENVLHVVVKSQGLEFVYTVDVIDRSHPEAQEIYRKLIEAIAERRIPMPQLDEMYRSTWIGAVDGEHFMALAGLLVSKGFRLVALEN